MSIEELIKKLLELKEQSKSDNKSLCSDTINSIFNNDDNIGDIVRPYIIELREELDSNTNLLFEEILKLVKKLK